MKPLDWRLHKDHDIDMTVFVTDWVKINRGGYAVPESSLGETKSSFNSYAVVTYQTGEHTYPKLFKQTFKHELGHIFNDNQIHMIHDMYPSSVDRTPIDLEDPLGGFGHKSGHFFIIDGDYSTIHPNEAFLSLMQALGVDPYHFLDNGNLIIEPSGNRICALDRNGHKVPIDIYFERVVKENGIVKPSIMEIGDNFSQLQLATMQLFLKRYMALPEN